LAAISFVPVVTKDGSTYQKIGIVAETVANLLVSCLALGLEA